ncbi:MAG: uncharacterized protein QOG50_673 [Actinomycetota bacterium]|jgi:uncharacterized OB-fold protein|nr:uncharacterized protein [Actinomycetota bacterium]
MLPDPIGLNAELYAHWARGELRIQRCRDCNTWRHPPRYLCATCGSARFTWDLAAGRGKVFSWTITHRAVDPAFEPPYAIVVVELAEGPRLVGSLTDLEPAELVLDLDVVVELEPVSDTIALVSFRPA